MTATQRAMMISLMVMAISFSMAVVNEWNDQYILQSGVDAGLFKKGVAPFTNASSTGIGVQSSEFNSTVNEFPTFNKPADIGFDFGFFQGITFIRLVLDFFINATYGFPLFLSTGFGIAEFFVIPLTIFINISHLLFLAYVLLGKSF